MAPESNWTFLTNHALVLLSVADDPTLTLRQIGDRVGITERATHRIIGDLAEAGYLTVGKSGRRNTYRVNKNRRLRHSETRHLQIRDLVAFMVPDA